MRRRGLTPGEEMVDDILTFTGFSILIAICVGVGLGLLAGLLRLIVLLYRVVVA